MTDWSLMEREWLALPAPSPFQFAEYEPYYQEKAPPPPQAHYSPTLTLMQVPPPSPLSVPVPMTMPIKEPQPQLMPVPVPVPYLPTLPRGDNPREIRNKAEKQRRDKLNQSIAELASMVPPVVAASRKIDKTGVLRLTAHYLRAHQYVFGETLGQPPLFSERSTRALLSLLNGFLLTTTYKGLVVVVSQNVKEYLGYSELDLLGQSIFNITHEEDRQMLKEQLMPRTQTLGPNGELIAPDEQNGRQKVAEALAGEKRNFLIRLKKLGQRSEPCQYVTCHVEGSLRKSDGACRGYKRCCQIVRRARARGDNPCSSGNDVVFIGVVRPTKETFINESALESYRMEYRTRHSIDGMIIQCEQRISLVTGYMTDEVNGVNAMNFIHRDEVRWVIVALQEMYNSHQLFGESCYRLMTKNGQFIYLRTRGRLDVDKDSRAVTTFVCTNTVVDEIEGKHLIKLMKEKFNLIVNNNDDMQVTDDNDKEVDNQTVAVEDPRQLEKVILHLVTNLPSPQTNDNSLNMYPDDGESSSRGLALIPPKKERIVSAIEKIYTVLKTIPKQPSILDEELIQPPAVSEHSFNQVYLQNQSITETDVTNNSVQSDFEYFKEIPVTFDGQKFTDVADHQKFTYGTDYQKFTDLTDYQKFTDGTGYQSSKYQVSDSFLPGPSTAGTKRPSKFDDQENITRKKIGVMQNFNGAEVSSNRESPPLETLFDEALLNREIESAIDSLDQTIDPNFPDLLISKEVQDILGNIESESEDE